MERDLAQQRVANDANDLAESTKDLLRKRAEQAGDKAAEVGDKFKDHLMDMRARLNMMEDHFVESTKHAANMADDFVHECPWKSIGMAAGVGLLLGLLIGRR